MTVKQEIPGQSKVIPGSLDRLLKVVKSLDCPGHPWTVGSYGCAVICGEEEHDTSCVPTTKDQVASITKLGVSAVYISD